MTGAAVIEDKNARPNRGEVTRRSGRHSGLSRMQLVPEIPAEQTHPAALDKLPPR
ncbi:MAG: hypothetical protein R3B91_05435 [Planctomycetaceae bacterium]